MPTFYVYQCDNPKCEREQKKVITEAPQRCPKCGRLMRRKKK